MCLSRLLRLYAELTTRYGPAPKNTDTAVNILLCFVADQSGKQYKMDHYATRYPTNVIDVAVFLVRLAGESIDFIRAALYPAY